MAFRFSFAFLSCPVLLLGMSLFANPLRVLPLIFLSGVLLMGKPVQAQSTRTMTDTIAVDPGVEVEIHAVKGSVAVDVWDRSSVGVHATIDDATSESGDPSEVQVVHGNGTLTIKPNGNTVDSPGIFTVLGAMMWEREPPTGPTTSYSVQVPADASVSLSLDAADATVSGVEGEVKVEGVSSSITVRDVGGKVLAGTLSGALQAEDVRGELLVGTFSGDLQANFSTLPEEVKMGSFSGDAEITLPADAAFDLKTDITWGGVTSDFAMPDSSSRGDGSVPIGGGGSPITFESFNGSLMLRAK
jgi:hypothetical protein